jgi:protein-S-isoprenylcysteine O-methyltransferase Ste14
VGLALLLGVLVGDWFWVNPPSSPCYAGNALLALGLLALATVALLRPEARASDGRWWVYLLCAVSIGYPHGYRFEGAADSLMPLVLWGRIALQYLGLLGLLSLGRSYAMLPALRVVRTGGLYAHVRHPVYACYLLADLGSVALQPSLRNAAVAAVGGVTFFLRALLEERVLARDPAYADYMRQVRWRFFPGVF